MILKQNINIKIGVKNIYIIFAKTEINVTGKVK